MAAEPYEPTWESLDEHPLPEWYADAKLGIFVHWGVYSVPAWAPPDEDYAEWYPYYMYTNDACREYHRERYGGGFEYGDFIDRWGAESWDPDGWAEFFADVGARYVVLTGEHHDGFALWDSHYTRYNAARMGPERDVVGELCEAVRDRGLRFGASYHANLNYYQPGFDGPFGHADYHGETAEDATPGPEYVDFMNAKHRELIREYDPDLLWFDTPRADGDHLHAKELLADYYNRAAERGEEVAVNDRAAEEARFEYGDFHTPEYDRHDEIEVRKWETCRGIGNSFGYHRGEGPDDHLDGGELVRTFVDVVSKNGNLLINVGPRADGTIPALQREPLEALGGWLDRYGEAIYGTTYWATSEDDVADVPVRYTWREGTLYAVCLDWPGSELELGIGTHVDPGTIESVSHVGGRAVDWTANGRGVTLATSESSPNDAPATAFALEGVPNPR